MSDLEKYDTEKHSPEVNVYSHDTGSYNEKRPEGELQRQLKSRHIAMIRLAYSAFKQKYYF